MRYIMCRVGNGLFPAPGFAEEFNRFVKSDVDIACDIKHARNSKFHRKFFALISLGYQHWSPSNSEAAKRMGVDVLKSFEVFREEVIITAGYYVATFGIGGEVKLVAKSISFGKMDQAEFDNLYQACVQVLIDLVFAHGTDADDVEHHVQELLRF